MTSRAGVARAVAASAVVWTLACADRTGSSEGAAGDGPPTMPQPPSGGTGGVDTMGGGPNITVQLLPVEPTSATTPRSIAFWIDQPDLVSLDVESTLQDRNGRVTPCRSMHVQLGPAADASSDAGTVLVPDAEGIVRLPLVHDEVLPPGTYVEEVRADFHYAPAPSRGPVDPANDFADHRPFEVSTSGLAPIDEAEYQRRIAAPVDSSGAVMGAGSALPADAATAEESCIPVEGP